MAYGFGKVGGKPFRKGSRGGVYWSGARARRYDPAGRGRWRGYARRAGGKVGGIINRYGVAIGAGLAALAGIGQGYQELNNDFPNNGLKAWFTHTVGGTLPAGGTYSGDAIPEVSHLWTTSGAWNPTSYLKYKFLGTHPSTGQYVGGAWVYPFWLSLVGYLVSKFMPARFLPAKFKTPLEKLSKGALIVSTIGALALPGSPATDTTIPQGITTTSSTSADIITPMNNRAYYS